MPPDVSDLHPYKQSCGLLQHSVHDPPLVLEVQLHAHVLLQHEVHVPPLEFEVQLHVHVLVQHDPPHAVPVELHVPQGQVLWSIHHCPSHQYEWPDVHLVAPSAVQGLSAYMCFGAVNLAAPAAMTRKQRKNTNPRKNVRTRSMSLSHHITKENARKDAGGYRIVISIGGLKRNNQNLVFVFPWYNSCLIDFLDEIYIAIL